MLRNTNAKLDFILGSMQYGYAILMRATVFWLMNNIGLCLFNIAIYGGRMRAYGDFLNAYTYTLYSQAALSYQEEEKYSMATFLFATINNLVLYFLNILLNAITLTSILSEYNFESL